MSNDSILPRSEADVHGKLLDLYRKLLYPRLIEEKMLLLLRQGKVSKWFSGIGQEAIAVGATSAMAPDEYILPLHRNLGVFTTRNLPLAQLFAQLQGKEGGFSKGRERSFHFGSLEHHIVGMISHLGAQLSVADGIALAHRLKRQAKATLVFSGDGGTSEGDFHEALNVAAVWELPVIFLIENNAYGLSTPVSEQYRCKHLVHRAIGYGIEGVQIDGNDLLLVHDTVSRLADSIRKNPRPVLVECLTFRMRGHEEASGTKYVPENLLKTWGTRDPVKNYEAFLLSKKILAPETQAQTRENIRQEIEKALGDAFVQQDPVPNTEKELADVFSPTTFDQNAFPTGKQKKMRFVDAISDALAHGLRRYDNLILMGQDIAEYGGVFKVSEGFVGEFGKERVRNTPLCESAIVGAALGLSLEGYKSVVEMQFADFVSCAFNQIVNNLAKIHYRWGAHADVVLRLPTGAGVGAGPFHSQSTEAWFFHVPGLKIVYPAFPSEAKGLLLASLADPNPVLYFEHKALYRSSEEMVAEEYFTTEIGKARIVRAGEQATIITYGMGVHWVLEFMERQPDLSLELLDLRTLSPLDYEAIEQSARKTGRVLILHEDTLLGGIGAELAAHLAKECFSDLDAPIFRCGSLDTPVPFSKTLENNFLAKARLEETLLELLAY